MVLDIRTLSIGLKGVQQEHVVQSIMESVLEGTGCLTLIPTCVSINLSVFTYVDKIKYMFLKRTFLRHHRHLVTVITTCVYAH